MCLNSRRWVLRLVPLFLGINTDPRWRFCNASKPMFLIRVGNKPFQPKQRGTNLETKLLKVRHMSRPKLFYLGLPTPFWTSVVKHVWPSLQLYKKSSWIGVGKGRFTAIKEGPNLKQNPSRLGICQCQKPFTLDYHFSFETGVFKHVWPSHNFEELGFKVGLFFVWLKLLISNSSQKLRFKPCRKHCPRLKLETEYSTQ